MKQTLSSFSKEKLQEHNNAIQEEDIKNEYEKIKDLSQQEASNRLMQEVMRQKQNGSFDFDKLAQQVDALKGYLPQKDFESLQKLLQTLR